MNQVLPTFFILVLNFSCQGRGDSLVAGGLQKIEARCVNLRTTTIIAVTCPNFENFFEENTIRSQILTKSSQWDLLINEINRIMLNGEKFNGSPDVRMKIQFHYEQKVEIVCVGNTLISVRGNNYLVDDSFREFIQANFE